MTKPLNRKYGDGPLGRYYDGAGHFPNFRFVRYWRQDPTEPVPSLADIVLPRLDPVPSYQRLNLDQAVTPPRSDMILPPLAPGDIFDIAGLLRRFDETPPLKDDVYLELKITFDAPDPAHVGWERARGWAGQFFAKERSLSVILVQHRPGLAGSDNPTHVHLFVPARPLTRDGFVGNAGLLCSDHGNQECWNSWSAAMTAPEFVP